MLSQCWLGAPGLVLCVEQQNRSFLAMGDTDCAGQRVGKVSWLQERDKRDSKLVVVGWLV